MPEFLYIATDKSKAVVTGKMEQIDRASAIEALNKQGLRPISIKEPKSNKLNINLDKYINRRRVKPDDLVMFTRQLSTMLSAGVPLLRALTALNSQVQDSQYLKQVLAEVISNVEAGLNLGDALAKHPDTFNDVYVNMVRAGEAAGILDEILTRLAFQQEKNMTMRKKIKSAMTYPIVLLCITILAFFGLMLFVIPQIGNILNDLGGANVSLPGITLFMLSVSSFITSFWYLIIIAIIALVYFLLKYIKTPQGKQQFHSLLLRLPIIKGIIAKISVARFARTFSALMGAGVAVLEALDVTSRAIGNVMYEKSLKDAAEKVKNGKNLSTVISKSPLFPPIVAQMLLVGEETGKTDTVLVKVADFYEEEVDAAVSSLSSIIEPVMIVIMGAAVGLIAASVMIPISSLAQSIQ